MLGGDRLVLCIRTCCSHLHHLGCLARLSHVPAFWELAYAPALLSRSCVAIPCAWCCTTTDSDGLIEWLLLQTLHCILTFVQLGFSISTLLVHVQLSGIAATSTLMSDALLSFRNSLFCASVTTK